ncbi:MAG: hypothetical protein KF824_08630 [Fimbriimonadaceae bacterium]|nr:MAG: hypothetical protein KF824_08630 [Fimbriimonadaceae bacterium]
MSRKPKELHLPPGSELFGTKTATTLIQLVYVLKDTYAKELADLTGLGATTVKNQLSNWENTGIISLRTVGRQRMVTLNPRFYAINELCALLERMVLQNPEILEIASAKRSRPRKTGKEI